MKARLPNQPHSNREWVSFLALLDSCPERWHCSSPATLTGDTSRLDNKRCVPHPRLLVGTRSPHRADSGSGIKPCLYRLCGTTSPESQLPLCNRGNRWQSKMLAKVWSNRNSHSLLVGMLSDTVWKTILQFLWKLSMLLDFPCGPAVKNLPAFLWGFPSGSDGKQSAWSAGDLGSIPGLGRFPWRR